MLPTSRDHEGPAPLCGHRLMINWFGVHAFDRIGLIDHEMAGIEFSLFDENRALNPSGIATAFQDEMI
jgi:hypothetical protein